MLFSKKPDASTIDTRGLRGARSVTDLADTAAVSSRPQAPSHTQSVIDPWLTVTGNLESQGDVRVEGQVAGDIRCASLVIGREAIVSGDIVAEEAVVRGRVKGTIRANRVVLQDTACVESAIYHKVLSIDEGATFQGQSCHRQQPHQEEPITGLVKPERDTIEAFGSNGSLPAGLQAAEA